MEKIRPWCGQTSYRGRLRNRTQHSGPTWRIPLNSPWSAAMRPVVKLLTTCSDIVSLLIGAMKIWGMHILDKKNSCSINYTTCHRLSLIQVPTINTYQVASWWLIHPTIWPQYTKVTTYKTHRQTTVRYQTVAHRHVQASRNFLYILTV